MESQNLKKTNEEKAASLCIRHKSLKLKATTYLVTLGTGTVEAELVAAVAKKNVMQDMEEIGSGTVETK